MYSSPGDAGRVSASSSKPVAVSEMLIENDDDDDDDDSGEDERDEKDNALRTFPESLKFADGARASGTHEEAKKRRRQKKRKEEGEDTNTNKDEAQENRSFCGVVGCQMHRGTGEKDTLKSQLEKLRPEFVERSENTDDRSTGREVPLPGRFTGAGVGTGGEESRREISWTSTVRFERVSSGDGPDVSRIEIDATSVIKERRWRG